MDESPLTFLDEPAPDAGQPREEEPGDAPLIIDDDDRYGRLRLIPWWRQERLASARVLVVGAGRWGTRCSRTSRCWAWGRST